MDDFSNQIASIFITAKYAKGESVALMMYNKPEYVAIWLGLAKLGVVTALINTNLRMESLVHCIKIANVRGIIFDAELAEGTILQSFYILFQLTHSLLCVPPVVCNFFKQSSEKCCVILKNWVKIKMKNNCVYFQ